MVSEYDLEIVKVLPNEMPHSAAMLTEYAYCTKRWQRATQLERFETLL